MVDCANGHQGTVLILVQITMLLMTKIIDVKIIQEYFNAKNGTINKWLDLINPSSSLWLKLARKDLMPLLSGYKLARVLWMAPNIMEVFAYNKRQLHRNGRKVLNFQNSKTLNYISGLSSQIQTMNRRSSTGYSRWWKTAM